LVLLVEPPSSGNYCEVPYQRHNNVTTAGFESRPYRSKIARVTVVLGHVADIVLLSVGYSFVKNVKDKIWCPGKNIMCFTVMLLFGVCNKLCFMSITILLRFGDAINSWQNYRFFKMVISCIIQIKRLRASLKIVV